MKRTFRSRILIIATACLMTASLGRADIVIMKSGDKYEGKILSETPDSIDMEYKLTAKIKDRKTFPKADIAQIKKQTASEVEFAERALAKLVPTPDLLTASDYEALIQDKLRTFAAKYPGTPETAQAEKIIATLADEKSKVLSGQLKVEGKWLDAGTVKRDAYNIEGYRLRMQMRNKAAENTETRYLEALRAFEKLRTDYAASTHYIEAIPEALAILGKFDTQIKAMITDSTVLVKQRQDGLKALSGPDAQVTKKSIEDEQRAHQTKIDEQIKARMKWRDIYKYDTKGLQDELATVAKETAELKSLDLEAVKAESESFLAVVRYMADGNLAEAENVLSTIGKQQNLANKILLASLRKELDAKKNAAKKLKNTATATGTSSATVASDDASAAASNPVAEAMKKIQEEKEKKAAEASKSGDKKAGGTTADKKPKTDGAKGDKPATDGAKPAATPATAAPQEESLVDKIVEYIPFIGGGLLVVLLAAFFMSKKKKKDE